MTNTNPSSVQGKTALVTGGGRGLGEAICETLANAGVRVMVADIREDLARTVAERLKGRGLDAAHVVLDVCDETQVENCLRTMEERFGGIDILVNNAAVDFTLPLDELSVGQWDQVIATNLRGPFLLSKGAIERMKPKGDGYIVNIASTAAKRAWPNAAAYHASKWGLLGLSHSLHAELRPHGIKVTAIIAGGMRTPFLLDRFPDIDPTCLQEPTAVAGVILGVLCLPRDSVVPEVSVLPMRETSWP